MSSTKISTAQVDLRGFSYPLAPYTLQQQWRMEKLQAQLAKAQAAVMEAEQKYDAMGVLLQTQSQYMQRSLQKQPDPSAYQQGLGYLTQLRHEMVRQRKSLEEVRSECDRLRTENITQQRKLDGLEEHKAQSLQTYAAEMIRADAAEADRDWTGRAHYRAEHRFRSEETSL